MTPCPVRPWTAPLEKRFPQAEHGSSRDKVIGCVLPAVCVGGVTQAPDVTARSADRPIRRRGNPDVPRFDGSDSRCDTEAGSADAGERVPVVPGLQATLEGLGRALRQPGRGHDYCQVLLDRLGRLNVREFHERRTSADLVFINQGITFSVYSDRRGVEKIFPFDLIPRPVAGRNGSGSRPA